MSFFKQWKNHYENGQFDKFNFNRTGLLWLKTKSIIRKELVQAFVDSNQSITLKQKSLTKQFEELFELLASDLENSHSILDAYIISQHQKQVNEIDVKQLTSELYKLKYFDWGGDYRNSLDKYLVSRYIKVYQSYESLLSKFDTEINHAVRGYVLNSWYNHWSSILIEHIFKAHKNVLPTVGQIKSVDFFINDTPFDLKVTYLPAEYIKLKRKEKKLPVELTFLKQKAKVAKIEFDKNAKDSDIYHEITEKMKDKNDAFCRGVLKQLQDETQAIIKDAQNTPKILAQWLYENQGEMRFGAENRLFLVLIDSNDLTQSWKLKRNLNLLEPVINSYLDKFDANNMNNLKLSFSYQEKSQLFTVLADIIFVIK